MKLLNFRNFTKVMLLACFFASFGMSAFAQSDTDYGLLFNKADGRFYLDKNNNGALEGTDTEYTGQSAAWSWDGGTNTLSLNNFSWVTPARQALTIVNGDLDFYLNITGTNTFKSTVSSASAPSAGISASTVRLIINGSGTLNATAGNALNDSFGIDAHVTVNGGTVVAEGGTATGITKYSAGISGHVNVNGGSLTATGSTATGINNRSYGIYDTVTITGGSLTAIGGTATITGSSSCGVWGDVNIIGGTVTVQGNTQATDGAFTLPSSYTYWTSATLPYTPSGAGTTYPYGTAFANSSSIKFVKITEKEYEVRYDVNGSMSTIATATVRWHSEIPYPPDPILPPGYVSFLGWKLSAVGETVKTPSEIAAGPFLTTTTLFSDWAGSSDAIESITLQAQYTEGPDITINYWTRTRNTTNHTAGGTVSRASETMPPSTGVALGSTATPNPGYHFVGWFAVGDTLMYHPSQIISPAHNYIPLQVGGVNIDTTYVALFVENTNVTINYTTYNLNTADPNDGGSVSPTSENIAPATGTSGGSTATASSGYRFVGWFESGADYEMDTPITTGGTFTPSKVGGAYEAKTYVAVFEPHFFCGGAGTPLKPYQICNAAQLDSVRYFLDKHFVLNNDINIQDESFAFDNTNGWLPIGTSANRFIGTFNGKGHKVTDLWINRTSTNAVGLFGYTDNAKIDSLGVEISTTVTGYFYVGGLVGYNDNSTITNCYATGNVSGTIYIGGLAGYNYNSTITNCYATGDVSGGNYIGGFVGYNRNSSTITNCYATGNVSGTGATSSVGGFVGDNYNATIKNCVAANNTLSCASTTTNRITGGNSSGGTLSNNYANSAMLVNGATVSGTTGDVNGADKTLATLKTFAFYNDATPGVWDGSEWSIDENANAGKIWRICPLGSLPFFQWQQEVVCISISTLDGVVTVVGSAIFGETLTANTTALTSTPSIPDLGTLTYQWKRGATNIGTNSATYTLVQADIAATITVTVTAANCTGNVASEPTATVSKATPTAPAAPTLLSKTATNITLNTITGCEYRRNGGTWQTSTAFNGLTPNTSYSFEARKAETETHLASPASAAASFTTDMATLTGTVIITGSAIFGETLTATTALSSTPSVTLGTLSYQWKRGATNIGTNSATYTLVQADIAATITVTVTAANCTGNVASEPTATVSKASQTAPVAPTLASKTATNITLNTITGCEYRRNGGAWQTSTAFNGLTPNTSYSFEARKAETETHLASPASAAASFTTDMATLTGTVIITGSAIFGETLTATTALSSTPSVTLGTLSYQWKRGATNIGTNSAIYTLVQADIAATITVTVTAANCTGSVASEPTATISKASQTAPVAPTLASKTATNITLNTITGCEYRRNGGAWQTSTAFNGLTPNTSYSFEARKAETATHLASPASAAASFTTDMATLTGTVIITGSAIFGETLTATTALSSTPSVTLGTLSYQWKRGATNIGTNSATYILVQADIAATITVTVTAANCTGGVTSEPTATVSKASQTAPVAPTLLSKTATNITLNTITGCEYRVNGGTWQTSTAFNGLTPNTSYSFEARKAETATHLPSPESAAAIFTTDISVASVEITNCSENGVLHLGETLQMLAQVLPENATNPSIIWSSSNVNTATVDQTGTVIALKTGATIITVTTVDGGFIAECYIRVIQPVASVVLNKTAITLQVEDEETLVAAILPENANIKEVVWESNDEAVAIVDANGKVTAVGVGTAIITVTTLEGGLTATCNVTVVAAYIAPTGITVTPTTLNLDSGDIYELSVEVKPANANPTVTWSSSNAAIAEVDSDGVVTAKAAGKATITAKTINGYSANCTVTVTIPVESVDVIPAECTIPLKGAKALKATVNPSDATNKTVTWSSSNTAIATVSSTGTVTAKSVNGTVEIYATAANGVVGTCTVTVGTGKSSPMDVADESITVYPNPTNGELRVTSYELQVTGIEIFDVTGRVVYTAETRLLRQAQQPLASLQDDTTTRLDISHLPTGIYFIRIETENGKIVTRKVVKN